MNSTTSDNKEVARIRKMMIEETTKLRKAINDDNALMANNEIGESLRRLLELKDIYADKAWEVHSEWVARNA